MTEKLQSRWILLGLAAGHALLSGCAAPIREDAAAAHGLAGCTASNLRASTRFSAESYDSGLPQSGQWRDGFDLADMNGDGRIDLIHGPARKGKTSPTIFLGTDSGRFQAWTDAHFPQLDYDYGDVKAGDFNNDGRMDFALAAHLRGLTTLIGEGSGNFAPWGEGLTMLSPGLRGNVGSYTSRDLGIVDWDGDGRLDLLAVNEGPSMYAPNASSGDALALFLNRNGYWERAQPINPVRGFGTALALGDIDGDSKPDAMIAMAVAGARLVLQMNTTTAFASRELRTLPPDAVITTVALYDFNRDHRAEPIAATQAAIGDQLCSALQIMSIDDDRESTQLLWREYSRAPVVAIAVGDIDDDHHADLIAVRENGTIMSFAGSRNGFTRDAEFPSSSTLAGCTPNDVRLADLDGRGGLELLVSYAGEPDAFDTSNCATKGGFQTWHLR